jgi:hypothetical protein
VFKTSGYLSPILSKTYTVHNFPPYFPNIIALGHGLDDRGPRVRFPAGAGNFSLHHRVENGSGAHPATYPMGTRGSFPEVKRPRCEADHSPPSSAEVKE